MPADIGGGGASRKVRRKPTTKTKAAPKRPAPTGDTKGAGEFKQAARYKKTVRYKRQVRDTYDEQPVKRRQQIVRNAKGDEKRIIAPVHKARVKRNRELGRHPQKPAAELVAGALAKTGDLAPRLKKPKGGGLPGAALEVAKTGALAVPVVGQVLAANKATGGAVKKIATNAPKDAYELAVTTPSSLALLAETAVKDPGKVPGMLAEPYKELAKDPVKFLTEKPVSTALMVQPAVRVPTLAAGKGARLAGKQTLERPTKTLPGTALKEKRVGSKDVVVRAVQARKDKKAGPQTMTDKEVQRRVDEFYDFGQQHKARVKRAAVKQAKGERPKKLSVRRAGALPKDKRQEHVDGAMGGAQKQVDRRFAEEFGSTWSRTKSGGIVRPKDDAKAVIHESRADAQAVAKRVPFDPAVIEVEGGFAVVPKAAQQRYSEHKAVGSSKAVGARVMRTAGKSFRSTVLPVSPRWLAGQGIEAAFRSTVAGAGPTSYLRGRKVIKKLEAEQPGKGRELELRATGGGQFGMTGTAREFADGKRTLAEEFPELSSAAKATKVAAKPGVKHVRAGWNRYSSFVFDTVNGAFEKTARTAMLGKAVKDSPLMERKVLGLSNKALDEAARGLKGTEAQVQLARAVDRMYGRYSKFGPKKRETLLHSTPFYPWYANMATFLTRVLPADHPVQTSLAASLASATEEWRKAHGLSAQETAGQVPAFLFGTAPTGDGGHRPVGRYLPFAPADIVGATGELVFPQFLGGIDAARGLTFTGKKFVEDGDVYGAANRAAAGLALALAEAHIPGVGPASRISGLGDRHVRGDKNKPTILDDKDLGKALVDYANPFAVIPPGKQRKKVKRTGAGGISPGGISQRELEQLRREASQAAPVISEQELEQLRREAGR